MGFIHGVGIWKQKTQRKETVDFRMKVQVEKDCALSVGKTCKLKIFHLKSILQLMNHFLRAISFEVP